MNGKKSISIDDISPAGDGLDNTYKFSDTTENQWCTLFEGPLNYSCGHYMSIQTSASGVNANANSFYPDGTDVYFRPSDDSLDHAFFQTHNHCGYSVQNDSNVGVGPWWHMENIIVLGACDHDGHDTMGNNPGIGNNDTTGQVNLPFEIKILNCGTFQTAFHSWEFTGSWPATATATLTLSGFG